jgi:NADPH:quinone reductase-like Zn-dependent oxidoreductase
LIAYFAFDGSIDDLGREPLLPRCNLANAMNQIVWCRILEHDALRAAGNRDKDLLISGVDLVFDVIGGDIQKRSAGLIRAGGTLVSVVGPTEARPADGMAVDFVVDSERAQLTEIVRRVRDGRLRTNIGKISALDDAVSTFNSTERRAGKTVIRVRP